MVGDPVEPIVADRTGARDGCSLTNTEGADVPPVSTVIAAIGCTVSSSVPRAVGAGDAVSAAKPIKAATGAEVADGDGV